MPRNGLIFFFAVMVAVSAQRRFPKFEDYKVPDALNWTPEQRRPIRYATPEQESMRNDIARSSVRFPQFAGHYDVHYLPCKGGDRGCHRLVIVDLNTGVIHGSPFGNNESQFALPPSNWDRRQPLYSVDSRLLVVPNVCPEGPSSCGTFYFVWQDGSGFRMVDKRAVSAQPVIPTKSPIVGVWEGEWSYTTGFESPSGKFRMFFEEDARSGKLSGRFEDSRQPKSKRRISIRDIAETRADKSSYRMNVGQECWNLQVDDEDKDLVFGLWNVGPCGSTGVGFGARLIQFGAKRIRTDGVF